MEVGDVRDDADLMMTKTNSDSSAEHVIVKPMTIHTGAEISGIDLAKPLTADEVKAIRTALLRWKVVFFRNQHLNHRQHIDFARQFGDLTPAHAVFDQDVEFPEIYPVTKNRAAFAGRLRRVPGQTGIPTLRLLSIHPMPRFYAV